MFACLHGHGYRESVVFLHLPYNNIQIQFLVVTIGRLTCPCHFFLFRVRAKARLFIEHKINNM